MEFLNRKLSLVPILLLLIASGSAVYAFTYFTVVLPSTIEINTEGNLVITDWEGNPLSSLDFGILAPGATVSKNVQIKNLSNREVGLIIQSDINMPWEIHKHDGSDLVHMMPLAAGDSLQIILTITAPSTATAGLHSFSFTFMGEG